MQMILKSMGVKVDKDELENYAGEADEAGTGKFSFTTFCQERGETRGRYSETGFHIGMDRSFVSLWRRHNFRSQVIDLSLSALIS
jgi:hypothetical protein